MSEKWKQMNFLSQLSREVVVFRDQESVKEKGYSLFNINRIHRTTTVTMNKNRTN